MAINIQHIHTAHFTVHCYNTDETHMMQYYDYGTIDDVVERVCTNLIKHNFDWADICSQTTGEVFTTIERT